MSFLKNLGRGALGALVFAGAAIVGAPALAADHRDGGGANADPASDINDVYSWMNGENLVVAMTVSPFAASDATFSPGVQFVWHVDAHAGFIGNVVLGDAPTLQTTIQCEFDEAQIAQCWIHRGGEILDYITGDASSEEGVTSDSSQLYAGLRADPFYFFLTGFNDARTVVDGELVPGPNGVFPGNVNLSNGTLCPQLTGPQLDAVQGALTAIGPGAQALNDFDLANTLAIVLEIDSALLIDPEANILSVHASTHAKPE